MDDFRTFEGKSIDDAISQALAYFDVARSQLEIEIISDAKTGIFGLVGARKAQIKARRRESVRKQVEAMRQVIRQQDPPGEPAAAPLTQSSQTERAQPEAVDGELPGQTGQAAPEASAPVPAGSADAPQPAREKSRRSRSRQKSPRKDAPAGQAASSAENGGSRAQPDEPQAERVAQAAAEETPAALVMDLDGDQAERIKNQVQLMLEQLLAPLVGEPVLQLAMPEAGKILVGVDAGEDAGLLIGKEGGTLAALQYLANRILAKQCEGPLPRLALEAGNYKERQDDTLRQLALSLAEKARTTGKAQSTRPLSSYHRRVIHMALQEDGGIVTRSKGEGALKRVVILPKKPKRDQNGPAPQDGAADESALTQGNGVEASQDAAEQPAKPRRPRRPRRRRGQGDAQRQTNGQTDGQANGQAAEGVAPVESDGVAAPSAETPQSVDQPPAEQ